MDVDLRLVDILGGLPGASNTTVLAVSENGRRWVYKPANGEQPLWDFPWKSLASREILAYEVSEALAFGVVPETVPAVGPFGPGSAQRFIDEDETFDPRGLLGSADATLWPVAVLDLVSNNADRKIGHLLRERTTGRLWAIDNGLTFHHEPKLRTVLWAFAGSPFPSEAIEGLGRLRERLAGGLAERLAAALSGREAQALVERVDRLLDDPVHPHPPGDRPSIPWPVW